MSETKRKEKPKINMDLLENPPKTELIILEKAEKKEKKTLNG